MYRTTILIMALSVFISSEAQAQTKADDKAGTPTITVTKLDISDKILKSSYEIRNDSGEDVWILAGICPLDRPMNKLDMDADVFMDEDNQTLVVRGRWGLPLTYYIDFIYGRYVRLRPGGKQTETVYLKIPVHPSSLLVNPTIITQRTKRQGYGLEYARRLVTELGYYTGNLPERIIND